MAGEPARPRLLLHACCGPCCIVPLERLRERFDPVVLFYGPNIHPRSEYLLRLEGVRAVCARMGVELIVGRYRPSEWGRAVRSFRDQPEGGPRCQACYRLRMEETAGMARELGMGCFAVTLTVSRHKDSRVLGRIGAEVGRSAGVPYLAEDFKKRDGSNLSVRRSKELGLRRQDYCGCSLSRSETAQRRRRREAAGS